MQFGRTLLVGLGFGFRYYYYYKIQHVNRVPDAPNTKERFSTQLIRNENVKFTTPIGAIITRECGSVERDSKFIFLTQFSLSASNGCAARAFLAVFSSIQMNAI